MKKILLLIALLPTCLFSKAQCPSLIARKSMASSYHSSIVITYDSLVRYWGGGASITDGTNNEVSPLTLSKSLYGGATAVALSVAGSSTTSNPASHTLFLHSNFGIYGWGNNLNTITNTTTGNVGFTNISIPVPIADVNFIEAGSGGLVMVTNSGAVYVRKGNGAGGPGQIYGDGSTTLDASGAATWHQVLTAAATPLTGVTRVSITSRAVMALTSAGTVYVWGVGTFLANGTASATRAFASLINNPIGVTPTDVNVNSFPTTGDAVQNVLGDDGKLYGVGNNDQGNLGQGDLVSTTNWVAAKGPGGTGTLNNVILIGSNNAFPGGDGGAINIGALTSAGNLYLWGSNTYDMIGGDTISTPTKDSVRYTVPRVPPNFTFNNAPIGYFEMGGHTTAAFLAGSSKFCYIGHKIDGSMGDGTTASLTRKAFDCINTPEEFVCPPDTAIGCPLPTANDIIATSNHATLAINGQPSVTFWGEAASSAEPGINLTAPKTLYEYSGKPKGVAASGVSVATSATSTQMWIHTTLGIWGWGYSANTILANRATASPITQLALPTGVTPSQIGFIRSSRGGIALITTPAAGGNVYIRAGFSSTCSGRIYGEGTSTLDAAGATTWHQVTTAPSTPLTGVIEMSFGGTAAIAITNSGTAYVWGDKTYLGDGTAAADRSRAALMTLHPDFSPSMVPRTAEIIQSGSLEAVQFILGTNNRIYSLGRNSDGALGNGTASTTAISTSWDLLSLTGVRKMSSNNPFSNGFYTVGAVLLTGNVYLWGSNSNGMIGQPIATTFVTSPTVATTVAANDATNLEIGGYETIIFTKSTSRFYFAGRNRGGSRANGSADGDVTPFALSGTVPNCANVAFDISGNLYNDNNGLTDNVVNGTGIKTLRTTDMYANLLDEAGYVIATTPISATGTYSFIGYPFANYVVQVSPTAGSIFSLAPTTALPDNWVYSGEQIGIVAGSGIDAGVPNGRIPVALSANRTNVNFGVQQLPTAVPKTLNARVNPGGTKTSAITTAFTGVDTLGTISKIHITGFPTNVTTLTVGATTYTATSFAALTDGITFPVGTVVNIDPIDGAISSVIPFKVIDNANFEGTLGANITVPFVLIPPVANNITAPALNSNDTARAIPQLLASNPSGTAITSYTVLTVPATTQGKLYYCASAPAVCALGSLTQITGVITITPAQSASLYFDPATTFSGHATFTYQATDENTLISNVANYIIPLFNKPPVTQNITTAQIIDTNKKAQIPDLIAADADGSIVSYTVSGLPAATSGTLSYCSNGTDTCTGTRLTIPVSGSTTLTPAQMSTMKFHPVLGATGNYIFNYTATDNNSLVSNTSTYTIPVVGLLGGNLPPVATNITAQNINNSLGATPIPNLLGTDPDGTVVSYNITGTLPPSSEGVLYYCVTPGAGCTLSPVTSPMTLLPAQVATLQFDPAAGFIGISTFTYSVTDNGAPALTSSLATYKIPVVNNPPVANPTSVSPILNTLTTPTLLPSLSGNDADGTIASYNIVTVPPAAQGTLKYCITPGAGCTLTDITSSITGMTPAQAATLNFVPVSTFTGNYVFTFQSVDNNNLVSQPATFTIPVIATSAMTVGQPPLAYSYNRAPINSASTAPLPVALTGTDPDGTVVNYTITSIPAANHGALTYCVTPPSTGCATAVGVGMVLSPLQAGTLLFTPDPNFMGIATFNYSNKDNDSNISNTATVTIPVNNNPPVANNINNPGITRTSSPVTLNPLVSTDADGTVVSYTIRSIPTADQGILRLCTTPPATGCVPVAIGDVFTGTAINRLSFTPDTLVHSPVITFLYSTLDNSGNQSNIAAVNIPVSNAFALPLDLLSFTASKQGKDALLKWQIGVEEEMITYELMNSTDGKSWIVINTQKGNQQISIRNDYSYLHSNVSGGVQYYRLKMNNENKAYSYSPVRTLNFDNEMSYNIQVQPNPVTDKLYLTTSDGSVMSQVVIYNNEGRKVYETANINSGSSIDMNSFSTGLYLLKIWDKNGETQTVKISKK